MSSKKNARAAGDPSLDRLRALLPLLGLIAFVLFLTMLAAYLVRTGPRRVAGDEYDIRLTVAVGTSPAYRASLERAIENFQREYPHVDVNVLQVAGRYYQKILIMMAGRVAPDIVWMGQSFGEFADRGAFLDITDRVAEEIDTSEFHPEVLDWYNLHGRQVGLPFTIDLAFIVYNKALFDEAGIDYPSDDWDFDEFLEKSRALTLDRTGDGRIDQFGFSGSFAAEAWGPPFVDVDGPRATVDTPGRLEYHQTMLRLRNEERIMPSVEDAQQEGLDTIGLFVRGRYAMVRMQTWNWQDLRNRLADMDWDIALYPKVRRRAHWASSGAMMITADTPHPDEAWALYKHLFGDEFQRMINTERGGVPANLRVARELVENHRGKPENYRLMLEASNHMAPFPRVPHLQEFLSIVSRWEGSIQAGLVEPAAGLRRAQHDLDRAIEQARERGAFEIPDFIAR